MTSKSDRRSTRPEQTAVEQVYRAEWGRLLSLLVTRTRRLDLAEDALSEAFARAAPVRGELARRAGQLQLARTLYRTALDMCTNEVERAHLRTRLASIAASAD
jgi:predicted RNA polymerase sigma factor